MIAYSEAWSIRGFAMKYAKLTRKRLISGVNIPIDFFSVKQLTLREMAEYEEDFAMALQVLLIDKTLLEMPEQFENLSLFRLVQLLILSDPRFKTNIIEALNFITDREFSVVDKTMIVSGEDVLTEDHFLDLQKVIREVYKLPEKNNKKEEEMNFADEEAQRMKEKFDKIHARIKEVKEKQQKEDTIFDMLIRFVSKNHNISLNEGLQLTTWQFLYLFETLIKTSASEDSFLMLLNRADRKKIKLTHWAEPK